MSTTITKSPTSTSALSLQPLPAAPTSAPLATASTGAVREVIPSPTERLRQTVSGAVDRINLGLLKGLGGPSKNPVLAGVLTAVQLAQLMPTMTVEQQKAALAKLGLPALTADQFREGVKAYVAKLTSGLPKDVTLTQGNFTYVQRGEALNPKLDAGAVKAVDFDKRTEAAATINKDIARATNDMIKDLAQADELGGAKVFLAAAAYVEAPWGGALRFDQKDTRGRTFTVDGASEPTSVKTMQSNTTDQRVLKGEGFEALWLPNGSAGELGTVYIKPKDGQTVAAFIAEKGEQGLRDILDAVAKVQPTRGQVRLPKTSFEFKPDSSAFLATLRTLGVPSSAQVLANSTLDISGAAYRGKAETSEEGIKMAAAQALIMTRSAMFTPPAPPPVFDGNRSMLQLVVKGDQVLFFNPIVDPNAGA